MARTGGRDSSSRMKEGAAPCEHPQSRAMLHGFTPRLWPNPPRRAGEGWHSRPQPPRDVAAPWLAWHLPVNQDRVFHKLRQPVGLKEQGDVEDHVAVACRNDSPRQKEQSRSHSPTPRSARAAQPQLLELYSCSGGKSRARLPSSLGRRKRFNSKLPQEKKRPKKKKKQQP